MAEQNFANHTKFVPAFHFFVVPILSLNVGCAVYRLFRAGFSWDNLLHLLVALALWVLMFLARIFALKVQDRVIRLEERLRLNQLLPDDLKPRIGDLSIGQLVALRFASDAELPALTRKVLVDKITDRKAIKQMVKGWRADDLRA
jgi:hypothetical protein